MDSFDGLVIVVIGKRIDEVTFIESKMVKVSTLEDLRGL